MSVTSALMAQQRNPQAALVEQLSQSQIFRDYERAFGEATGLPLSLRPLETWQPVHSGKARQNPFCALMAKSSPTCAACLQMQDKLGECAGTEPKTMKCFAGLCDTAVPLRVGENLIGFLHTGQVLLQRPTRRQFARTTRQLLEWGVRVDLKQLEDAYFHTRVLPARQYQSMIRLLNIFAQHLSLICHQVAVRKQHDEPPAITRARQFIREHQAEKLSLAAVARAANMSAFYFCKMFKKATGLNFTDYVSRVRVEQAKNLLLNPHARISEVAYAVGFQSLTHFNRVFRKLAGQSPTAYRAKLPKA